jgi:hypothetical protein
VRFSQAEALDWTEADVGIPVLVEATVVSATEGGMRRSRAPASADAAEDPPPDPSARDSLHFSLPFPPSAAPSVASPGSP